MVYTFAVFVRCQLLAGAMFLFLSSSTLEEYNWERCHEALERKTPGSVHCLSPRSYPAKLPEVQYESGITVRQVRHSGEIKWRGELIYTEPPVAAACGLAPNRHASGFRPPSNQPAT